MIFKWLTFSFILTIAYGLKPCVLRRYPAGLVCVCNATYCDTLDDAQVSLSDPNQVIVLTSSSRGLRFHRTEGTWDDQEHIIVQDAIDTNETSTVHWSKRVLFFLENLPRHQSNKAEITVNASVSHQTIKGFGGAMTGSVAHNLDAIPEALAESLIESYYSDTVGIGYNMLRMAIGGSDFDLSPWTYNELPLYDAELTNFTQLDPRHMSIVKRIKKIQSFFLDPTNRSLKIKAAAWGGPRWMRTPSKRTNGPGVLKLKYYQTWANYHIRFLELMKAQDIDIWALSVGNEPLNGLIGWLVTFWLNIGWTPKAAAKYVSENLGPTLRSSQFNKTLILAGDDQRFTLPWYFEHMKEAYPKSMDYVDGLALHSYFDTQTHPGVLNMCQELFPDKFILYTESSIGDIRYNPRGPLLGSWDRAVEYIDLYMGAFQHQVVGWIDWNLALDESGGPNYVGNVVDSPIIVNATGEEAYKQPIFYAIGHFSKFAGEGSVRIDVQSDWKEVNTIGFRRRDGSIAVVIHNRYFEDVEVTIRSGDGRKKTLLLPPDSISTVVYAGEEVHSVI